MGVLWATEFAREPTQVVRQLQAQSKLRDASDQPDSPSYIRDRTPLKKGQITTQDLRDEIRRDPALPILLSDDVFRKAVVKGVEEGVYIYQRGSLLAGKGDPIPAIQIDVESVVFTMDFARSKGIWPRPALMSSHEPTIVRPITATAGGGGDVITEDFGGAGFREGAVAQQFVSQVSSAKTFSSEGVLKEALRKVFEQARSAKLDKVDKLSIRVFDHADAFKLIPISNSISGAKKTITMSGEFITAEDSNMAFEFSGAAKDASTIKDYFEPQFRAAKESDLKTTIAFEFESGLLLGEDVTEKFIEKLTRFASATAYVEASAEVK